MEKKKNIFAGADDIYLTKNYIAVRKVSSYQNKKGEYKYIEKTRYYPKTPSNLRQAKKIYGSIRYGKN